jgi:hypothetical protein
VEYFQDLKAGKLKPKPAMKPAPAAATKPAARAEVKIASKSAPKPAGNLEAKPGAKLAVKSEAKPAAKVALKPAAKPEAKPEPKAVVKATPAPAAKPAPKLDAKPTAKTTEEVPKKIGGTQTSQEMIAIVQSRLDQVEKDKKPPEKILGKALEDLRKKNYTPEKLEEFLGALLGLLAARVEAGNDLSFLFLKSKKTSVTDFFSSIGKKIIKQPLSTTAAGQVQKLVDLIQSN